MSTLMFAVTIVLFVGIAVVTIWGWTSIPDEGRFPWSFGVPPSTEGTMGKRAGLVLFLLIGAWFAALSLFAASKEKQVGWVGVGLLGFFLAIEYRLVHRLVASAR